LKLDGFEEIPLLGVIGIVKDFFNVDAHSSCWMKNRQPLSGAVLQQLFIELYIPTVILDILDSLPEEVLRSYGKDFARC